jgi:hypothetical protein
MRMMVSRSAPKDQSLRLWPLLTHSLFPNYGQNRPSIEKRRETREVGELAGVTRFDPVQHVFQLFWQW